MLDCVDYFSYCVVFFFKQKTAYEMRISDWSSDVCSSDLEEEGTRINVCSSSLTLGYAPIGEESRAGYYPHDGESPAPVNLTGLDARLILGLIKFEGLNESFDQMAEVSLVLIGNAVSGPRDVVSEDYNLIPDGVDDEDYNTATGGEDFGADRTEENKSELPSLMRSSYAVFCLKKKNNRTNTKLVD